MVNPHITQPAPVLSAIEGTPFILVTYTVPPSAEEVRIIEAKRDGYIAARVSRYVNHPHPSSFIVRDAEWAFPMPEPVITKALRVFLHSGSAEYFLKDGELYCRGSNAAYPVMIEVLFKMVVKQEGAFLPNLGNTNIVKTLSTICALIEGRL